MRIVARHSVVISCVLVIAGALLARPVQAYWGPAYGYGYGYRGFVPGPGVGLLAGQYYGYRGGYVPAPYYAPPVVYVTPPAYYVPPPIAYPVPPPAPRPVVHHVVHRAQACPAPAQGPAHPTNPLLAP